MIPVFVFLLLMTETDVYNLAKDAGFKGQEAHTATCVAKYESNLDPDAVNVNSNRTVDKGLMQINTFWWGEACKDLDLFDAADNMECAYRVFVTRKRSFSPWVAYNKNKLKCSTYIVAEQCELNPIITVPKDEPWDKEDDKVLKRARKVCSDRYNKCVKRIDKKPNQHYDVTCG
jgi:hypothetical protein